MIKVVLNISPKMRIDLEEGRCNFKYLKYRAIAKIKLF